MSTENTTETTTNSQAVLGFREIFPIALGTVIGAGIVSIVGSAIAVTGASMWLAYMAAIVVGFVAIFPFIILSATVKMEGGFYSFTLGMFGKNMAGAYALMYLPQSFGYALYGTALATYINSVLPWFPIRLGAIAMILLFLVINLMGVMSMARAQKVMFVLLMACFIMLIVVGMTRVTMNPLDFKHPDFLTGGTSGFVMAIVMLSYSTTTYYQTVNFGNLTKNPKRTLPFVLCVCPLVLFLIYGGVSIVAGCVLPVAEVAGKPLTVVAQHVLPTPLFILFIVGGPIMAIATSLNAGLGSYFIMFRQLCVDGWVPAPVNKINKNGQPIVLAIISALIGIIPVAAGLNISAITSNTTILMYLTTLIPASAVIVLPKKYPEAWKASVFSKLPMPLFYAIVVLSVLTYVFICVMSSTNVNTTTLIVTVAAVAAVFIYASLRSRSGKVDIQAKRLDW